MGKDLDAVRWMRPKASEHTVGWVQLPKGDSGKDATPDEGKIGSVSHRTQTITWTCSLLAGSFRRRKRGGVSCNTCNRATGEVSG